MLECYLNEELTGTMLTTLQSKSKLRDTDPTNTSLVSIERLSRLSQTSKASEQFVDIENSPFPYPINKKLTEISDVNENIDDSGGPNKS